MSISPDLLAALKNHQSFLTHVHTGPDPDTIGATLAFKHAFEAQGKVVTIFSEDDLITASLFLPGIDDVKLINLTTALATYPHDAYISLDTATPKMITHKLPAADIHAPIINIDHHPDNIIPAKYSYIDSQASSACEILLEVLEELEMEITSDIATCLLFGIMGDSVVFQSSATTGRTLAVAGKLIKYGGDYQACLTALTRSFTQTEMRSYGFLLHHLQVNTHHKYVLYSIDNAQYQELGSQLSVGVFSNFFANKIVDTNFCAVLVEKKPGLTSGSLRARTPDFDVSQIAHLMGGGGHKAAAAFRAEKSLPATIADFEEALDFLASKNKL